MDFLKESSTKTTAKTLQFCSASLHAGIEKGGFFNRKFARLTPEGGLARRISLKSTFSISGLLN
ncbi:hypothetical protein IJG29_01905, partial [Candidatus Saccharibacteria bacterium]|nr:hypothetical protein [Candidatus Saccharibacteria bacterium]